MSFSFKRQRIQIGQNFNQFGNTHPAFKFVSVCFTVDFGEIQAFFFVFRHASSHKYIAFKLMRTFRTIYRIRIMKAVGRGRGWGRVKINFLYSSIVHIFFQLCSKTCLFFFFRKTLFMIDHDCSHSLSFPSFSQKVIYIIIHDENMPFPIKILAPFIHKLFK